jgi:hypothetical protein
MAKQIDEFQWHARPKRKGDDISDPISGEFFADGSLENPATALVREALQNAIDAGKNIDRNGKPVRVRFSLYEGAHSLAPDAAHRWFSSLVPHLNVPGNGLRSPPSIDEPCPFLVIDDFGTSGLTGDVESDAADGERNNYVDFLRSDGRTRKSEGDRGSWGVGKNVFPRSSRINTYIAFTVRHDDKKSLLLGKSILKIRRVGGIQYQPPCYLGQSWADGDVPRPYLGESVHDQFRQDFRVSRTSETGLTIAIPWLDPDVRFADIRSAVVQQYYFAILSGALTVELAREDVVEMLDSSSIRAYVTEHFPELIATLELAQWAQRIPDSERILVASPGPKDVQRWEESLLPDDSRLTIGKKLLAQERIAIRVPLWVHEIDKPLPEQDYFDVYLEHDDSDRALRPAFLREQLLISGVKRAMGAAKTRSLVIIERGPLADLLRSAEPPNHTDWDPKTGNFRKRYKAGERVITYVKNAVKQIMTYVRTADDEPDPNITLDFFALPDEGVSPPVQSEPHPAPAPGDDPPEPPPLPPPSERPFVIRKLEDGFLVSGDPSQIGKATLQVEVAYDVLAGNPWKQFDPADFDLRAPTGVTIEPGPDALLAITGPNCFCLEVRGPDFATRVAGFDPLRDVIVRVTKREQHDNGNSATELYEAEETDA